MDPRIEQLLRRVTNRFQNRRFAYLLTLFWVFSCIAIYGLSQLGSTPRWTSPGTRPWLFAGLALVATTAWLITRFSFRDLHWVAQRIEMRYPDLKQRLLTAVGIESTSEMGYLRRTLVDETIQHSRRFDWRQTVSSRSMISAWFLQFLACVLCLITSVSFLLMRPKADSEEAYLLPGIPSSVQVEPGSIEIERGTNVVVTARFSPRVPVEAYLHSLTRSGSLRRQEMKRNLKDPIYGGYLLEIQEDSEYWIDYQNGKSDRYRLDVFDYPALVRSDASIHPPSYAHQSDRLIPDTRRITVVEGTELTWLIHVNKQLTEAWLRDDRGTDISLEQSASNPLVYSATITLNESTRWKLLLKDDQGREPKIEESLSAKVLPNLPAESKLAQAADQSVSPLEEIRIQATASDDHGLVRVGLSYSLSDQAEVEVVLAEGDSLGKKKEVEHWIELEKLQAEPDQMVGYHFWVEDLDRDGEVRRTDGDLFFAEVRPFDEIFRQGQSMSAQQMQQQQQQQGSQGAQKAEELAELQKKIMTSTWNLLRRETPKKLTDSFDSDVEVIADSQQEALEQAEGLSKTLSDAQSQKYVEQVTDSMQQAKNLLSKTAGNDKEDPRERLRLLRDALTKERTAYEGLLKLRAREHQIVQSQQQPGSQRGQSAGQQDRQQQIDQLKLSDEKDRFESERQAQPPEEEEKREMRQVMSRLEELARRQKDINQQLKDLETALQEAKTQEEKKELEDQLKRLRENQEELLRDSDELLEKMNEAKDQSAMQDAQRRVEEARKELQKSTESLSKNQTAPALSAGSRAERQLEETREQLRQESSSAFEKAMRDMVDEARRLEKNQQQLNQEISPEKRNGNDQKPSDSQGSAEPKMEQDAKGGLRPDGDQPAESNLREEWKKQKQALEQLLNEMKETVTEAEASEPLLAEELYDSFRKSKQSNLEPKLDEIPMMLDRRMTAPARQAAEEVSQGITQLREKIESASERVLGSETEGLRRALQDLEQLKGQVQEELRNRSGQSPSQPQSETTEQGEESNPPNPEERSQTSEGNPQNTGERSQNPQGSPPNAGERPTGQNQESPNGRSGLERIGREANRGAPLTGNDFADWSDRLRDVEEMVRDPELRADAARIRETARDMRKEFMRHSKEPQWDLVDRLIAKPLDQLRKEVEERLLRASAEKNAIVPIDRDPVPNQYQRRLQKYYENIGL